MARRYASTPGRPPASQRRPSVQGPIEEREVAALNVAEGDGRLLVGGGVAQVEVRLEPGELVGVDALDFGQLVPP